ncbi:MAG: hypothetical protein JRN11_04345 [Nitrososphaerota archaeon]|nr:hypothetical protein [Nitrososphaerota archaeon]MDG7025955.1 hypothetical protein [Nitrososphaerota archaeon]
MHGKMRKLSLANSPYCHFLVDDENFRRWVEALERGSIQTAANYFRKVPRPASNSAPRPRMWRRWTPGRPSSSSTT